MFWLQLPLDVVPVAAPSMAPVFDVSEGTPAPPLTRPLRVLVVDDVLMNRDIAGAFLRKAGYEVVCLDSGAASVAAAASADFDVILMDVRMPDMDGLEATRRIRALEGRRGQVPVVAMTAQTFTDQLGECWDAGMDSHVAKPFDPEILTAAVARAAAAERTQGRRESVSGVVAAIEPVCAPVIAHFVRQRWHVWLRAPVGSWPPIRAGRTVGSSGDGCLRRRTRGRDRGHASDHTGASGSDRFLICKQ